MKFFANAYPTSGIEKANFTLEGWSGPSLELPLAIGRQSQAVRDFPPTFRLDGVDFKITAQSEDKSVTVVARHIPLDSEVHLIGVSKFRFLGFVLHEARQHRNMAAPRCELRCSPNDPAVTGPGCISCKKGKLEFKVCC
jgi:hypothetical protein